MCIYKSNKPKAFTLVELLVVIAIIGLLSTVVLITTKGLKDRAIETRKINNRRQAKIYCTANPGYTILKAPNAQGVEKEYHVYCDSRGNMWTETLDTDFNKETAEWYGPGTLNINPNVDTGKFYWSTPDNIDIVEEYKINDCNEIPIDDLPNFPACNACATLNYAGFTEGWRLPSQRIDSYNIESNFGCGGSCARSSGVYCGDNRQLWDFAIENCINWNTTNCDTPGQGSCQYKTNWDRKKEDRYWSSTQNSDTIAWSVYFSSAAVGTNSKSESSHFVRCFLGEWP